MNTSRYGREKKIPQLCPPLIWHSLRFFIFQYYFTNYTKQKSIIKHYHNSRFNDAFKIYIKAMQ